MYTLYSNLRVLIEEKVQVEEAKEVVRKHQYADLYAQARKVLTATICQQ